MQKACLFRQKGGQPRFWPHGSPATLGVACLDISQHRPTLLPNAVAFLRDQLERVSERASPCRYLTPVQWATMRESAIDSCDRFGADAFALGWTERQLFGVHPQHGTLRVDYCGALMVTGKRATGVEADRVLFERTAAYRTTPGKAWGPPIWEFTAKGG